MKKYTFWSFICVLIVLTALAVILSHKNLNASEPEISNFSVTSDTSYDDFYTDVNGFLLNRKLKGTFSIDSQTEFFVCYYSTSSNYLVLLSTYIFTDTNVVDFEDDFLPIYDSNLLSLIQLINNWLLNHQTGYDVLLSNAIYYIINDYVNSVGFYYSSERLALIRNGYNDDYYNTFVTNFGELNSTYCYRDLMNHVYSYYSDILEDIDAYFQDQIEYEKSLSYDEGYSDGLISDSNSAYLQGKSAGYTEAIEEGKQVTSYIFGMWDTMMNGIRDMFNVNIFGINLSSVIFFVLSIGVIGFVLRRIF